MAKARKLKKADGDGSSGALDKVYKDIEKKYGNIIVTGAQLLDARKDYKIVKISPMADVALGGGIREGSWLMLSGAAKSGKTTLAMQMARDAQQEGRPVIYVNAEGRLKEMNFEIEGLDPDKMQIVTAKDEPLSAEILLDIAHKLVSAKENEGCICIIDSVSSLIPSKELEEDVTGSMRPGLPKILSNFTKKMGQIVPNQKAIIIMITHLITNTSGYGPGKMADSGVKIQYQADTRMEVKSVSPWEEGDTVVGQAVTWKVLCSSVGPPNTEFVGWIRYGEGIDKVQEIIMMGQEAGLISASGAWYTCDFLLASPHILNAVKPDVELDEDGKYVDAEKALKSCKVQGQAKLYAFIKDNPVVFAALEASIEEMLC